MTRVVFSALAVPKSYQLLINWKASSKKSKRKTKLNFSWLFTGRVVLDINTVEWKG